MTIRVKCEPCQKSFGVKDEHAGKVAKCPLCRGAIKIPVTEDRSSGRISRPDDGTAVVIDTLGKAASNRPRDIRRPKSGEVSDTSDNDFLKDLPPTRQKRPTAATDPNQLMREILAGFQGDFPRVVPTPAYRLAALVVASVMILLPLIYVALIGLSVYGLWWHATVNASILTAVRGYHAGKFVLFAYLAPLVIGGIMVLFMIKPLFARAPKRQSEIELSFVDEPILHSFVHRLCDAVNAPYPSVIEIDCEVNASASFRNGWSGFWKNDLVLTIGLPLMIAMDTRQFAGVLAHEFGHFSQGAGMRLSYIIRSINFWFVRVIYERDEWDEWLSELADEENIWLTILAGLTIAMVWLSRRMLWVLMIIGHVVACTLLRQMEYDADKYEARLAGSDVFESTTRRMVEVVLANMATRQIVAANQYQAGLPDNLPLCLYKIAGKLPAEMEQVAHKMIEDETTSFFASHPAHRDRIAAAKRQRSPGIFQFERPAKVLLKDFTKAAENATLHLYKQQVGKKAANQQLVPTAQFLSQISSYTGSRES
jgi:Zn-dependent protease with chaperone function